MSDAPATRLSLLVRLCDARDDGAWSQFVELYAPLVYGFARKHGLQDADAADLTQDVLQAVSGGIRRLDYDPRRGSFRGWLFTVVRNKLRNFLAAQKRPGRGTGDSDAQRRLQELPAREEDQSAWWDQEYEQRVFAWAAEQVRGVFSESTWQAFWQTAIDGKTGPAVAKILGMSVAAVYLAKGRVMARLKEVIRETLDESA
ncbi:MAG TPA: sigma-70 family RNA polymerase sigma factor [Gemmataceae bacterium]|nr:sigma-70 family RNA polymerase sigma factor [Gemmataceae bacterium]